MPLPTGIMPHSADFTAPTDGTLHLPSSKLDSRRPAGHVKNFIKLQCKINFFNLPCSWSRQLRWAPDHTSLHQLDRAHLASGDAARGGMVRLLRCMFMFMLIYVGLTAQKVPALGIYYSLWCPGVFLSIIGTGAFLGFRMRNVWAENDHCLEYLYCLETSLCFDQLLNHTITSIVRNGHHITSICKAHSTPSLMCWHLAPFWNMPPPQPGKYAAPEQAAPTQWKS